MSDITIRLYQEGDEHGIVDLLNTVFEPWPQFDIPCSSLDHWIWKHKENPIGESIIVVAEKNDEIIGSMHSMLKRVKIGYSIVPAISGLDEATHPDFRGMGIYSKIRDMMYEERENSGIQYMYGGTTNPILIASSKRRGEHTYPHNLKTFVKLYDLDLYFKKNPRKYTTILKYGYLTLKLLNSVLTNRNREKNRYPNIQVEKIERFDDDINDFCNKITSYYNFIIQRNKEYLNWRYSDKKGGEYQILSAKEKEKTIGYIVIRINRFDTECLHGYFVDLITLPGRDDAAFLLVKRALEILEKEQVSLVTTIEVINGNYMKPLRTLGFLNSRQMIYVTYKYHEIEEEITTFRTSHVKKSHLVYGDYDWI